MTYTMHVYKSDTRGGIWKKEHSVFVGHGTNAWLTWQMLGACMGGSLRVSMQPYIVGLDSLLEPQKSSRDGIGNDNHVQEQASK